MPPIRGRSSAVLHAPSQLSVDLPEDTSESESEPPGPHSDDAEPDAYPSHRAGGRWLKQIHLVNEISNALSNVRSEMVLAKIDPCAQGDECVNALGVPCMGSDTSRRRA